MKTMNNQFAFLAVLAVVCVIMGHWVFGAVLLFLGVLLLPSKQS